MCLGSRMLVTAREFTLALVADACVRGYLSQEDAKRVRPSILQVFDEVEREYSAAKAALVDSAVEYVEKNSASEAVRGIENMAGRDRTALGWWRVLQDHRREMSMSRPGDPVVEDPKQ